MAKALIGKGLDDEVRVPLPEWWRNERKNC